MSADREPTQDELLAMAYADGEIAEADRATFETRMSTDAALARQVSEYRAMAVLAQHMAPPEPMDHEWARLSQDVAQRTGLGLGWLLFVVGSVGLAAWSFYELITGPMEPVPKALISAAITGVLLLLGSMVRARLRTLPYDPYREVQR